MAETGGLSDGRRGLYYGEAGLPETEPRDAPSGTTR
jgi:hypothetical protein